MIVMVVIKKIKSLLLLLLNLLKRCFCCLRKRRYSDSSLPVSICTSETVSNKDKDEDGTRWDSWDGPSSVVSDGNRWNSSGNKMTVVEQHIQEYRLSQKKKLQETTNLIDDEPEPNYFEDLAPKINKKPQVLLLAHPEEDQQLCNRSSFNLEDPLLQSNELQDWDEEEQRGWEEEAEEEADLSAALREQKQKERQTRKQEQLRRKAEKEAARIAKHNQVKLATKLS